MKESLFFLKILILCSFILLISESGYAQKISRSSINPFGLSSTNGNLTLQQTAGQSCDYKSLKTTGGSLHQGFIQGIKNAGNQDLPNISCNLIPNPGNGLFALYFAEKTVAALSMRIFKISGECVSTYTIPQHATQFSFELNSCAAGVYFIRLEGPETAPISKKLILTR